MPRSGIVSSPLVVTAAVNGAETRREQTPYVPYTPDEIAEEARRCREAGASIVHVHGRKPDGTPTQDRETFRRIDEAIRERTDVLVQFSTGGSVEMDLEERIEALDLQPDMATLTTGTVNFGEAVFWNSLPMIREIADRLDQYDVPPEIEIFDTGMVDTALRLVDDGRLELPLHFDFVLGVPGGMGARPEALDFLTDLIPEESTWSVAGIGRHELTMAWRAVHRGGHVRVGLEDNVYLEKGVLARGSWELVEEVVSYADDAGREIADPEQAIDILDIEPPRR
jgi:3-keto-5-aminohexanoate cleavage enzyme